MRLLLLPSLFASCSLVMSHASAQCCGSGEARSAPGSGGGAASPLMGPLNQPMTATLSNGSSDTETVTMGDSSVQAPPGAGPASFTSEEGGMTPQPGENAPHIAEKPTDPPQTGDTQKKKETCPPEEDGYGTGAVNAVPSVGSGTAAPTGHPSTNDNTTKPGPTVNAAVNMPHQASGGISVAPGQTIIGTGGPEANPASAAIRFSAGVGLSPDARISSGILLPRMAVTQPSVHIEDYRVRSAVDVTYDPPLASPPDVIHDFTDFVGTTLAIINTAGEKTVLTETASPPSLSFEYFRPGATTAWKTTVITELASSDPQKPANTDKGWSIMVSYNGQPALASTTLAWVTNPGENPAVTVVTDASGVRHEWISHKPSTTTRTLTYLRGEGGTDVFRGRDTFTVLDGVEKMTESKIFLDSTMTSALTTTRQFWSAPGTANHGRLQKIVHGDGRWSAHCIDESSGKEYTVTTFSDITPMAVAPTATVGQFLSAAFPHRLETVERQVGGSGFTPVGAILSRTVKAKGYLLEQMTLAGSDSTPGGRYYEHSIDGVNFRTESAGFPWIDNEIDNTVFTSRITGRLNTQPVYGDYTSMTETTQTWDPALDTRTTTVIEKDDSASGESWATQTVSRRSDGRQLLQMRSLNGTVYEVTVWNYDPANRITSRVVNGVEREAWSYPSATEVTHRAEDGTRTTTEYDDQGRVKKETRLSAPAATIYGSAFPAQIPVVTTWSYDPRSDGHPGSVVTSKVSVTGGSTTQTRDTVTTYDGAGRVHSVLNPDGSARSYSYVGNAVYEYAAINPTGTAIRETHYYPDGTPGWIVGPAADYRDVYFGIDADFQKYTLTYTSSNHDTSTYEYVDGLGRTIYEQWPSSFTSQWVAYSGAYSIYDSNYRIASRNLSASGWTLYEVSESTYENGVSVNSSGRSVGNAVLDVQDTDLRRSTSYAQIDTTIPVLNVSVPDYTTAPPGSMTIPVSFGWRVSSSVLPQAVQPGATFSIIAWEGFAAAVRKSPLSQRPVVSWLGHTANSIPQSHINDGGSILTAAEARTLSSGILYTERRVFRDGNGSTFQYRKSVGRDGVDHFFSSPEAANIQLRFTEFREPRAEFSWETIPWWPRLAYNLKGQVESRRLPRHPDGAEITTETYAYYPQAAGHQAGRVMSVTTAATPSGITYYSYNPRGQVIASWGSGTSTTLYTYDDDGRMTTMKTFQVAPIISAPDASGNAAGLAAAFASANASTTTWTYPFHGLKLISSKQYQGQPGSVEYTYTEDGLLDSRTWERTDIDDNRLVTRYAYNDFRQLTSTKYGFIDLSGPIPLFTEYATTHANYTPSVTLAYDAAGRVRYRTDGVGGTIHTRYTYRHDGSPLAEVAVASASDAALEIDAGKHLRRGYDGFGRLGSLESAWGQKFGAGVSEHGSDKYSPRVAFNYTGPGRLSSIYSAGFTGTITKTATTDAFNVAPNNYSSTSLSYLTASSIYRDSYGRPSSHAAAYTMWYYGQNYYNSISSTPFTWNADRLASRGEGDAGWSYGYDSKGQVASAQKTSAGAVLKGTETAYYYDDIGNRTQIAEGTAPNLRTTSYTSNALNQYTYIARPQKFAVTGKRTAGASIVVNGTTLSSTDFQPASTGLYFHHEEDNTPGPPPQGGDTFEPLYVTQNGARISDIGALQYVGPAAESPSHDADGNLLADGRWTYTWDGENRLIKMQSAAWTQPTAGYQAPADTGTPPVPTNSFPAVTIEFKYDGLSRRVEKKTTIGTGTPDVEGYLYDGWNVVMIAKLNTDGSYNLRKWSCIWRPDVASSLYGRTDWQKAGGVGGLAWMQTGIVQSYYAGYTSTGGAEIHIPFQDHMGNVRHYYRISIQPGGGYPSGAVSANFEYDAFGREVRAWGASTPTGTAGQPAPPPGLPAGKPWVDQLPFHFSTKFTDAESGFNYYGYRFYDPLNGRWPNRDPIGEWGGDALYLSSENSVLNKTDYLGLEPQWFPPVVRKNHFVPPGMEPSDQDIPIGPPQLDRVYAEVVYKINSRPCQVCRDDGKKVSLEGDAKTMEEALKKVFKNRREFENRPDWDKVNCIMEAVEIREERRYIVPIGPPNVRLS